METIKVNMNPNPLDVQTIHASQNDGEARQWGFKLHNNGELIDTSDVKEQMVFKAYKGGTEQLLPENTSTPTTSPFIGDIRYPQGLLNDQEFTYRQSPTESDGLAKITDIKGNTLVWNQLIKNGNFETATDWINSGSSYTVSNGVATVKSINASNQFGIYQRFHRKANHTYFISFEMHPFGTIRVRRNKFSGGQEAVTEGIYQRIETALTDTELGSAYQICFGEPVSDINTDYFTLKNYMIIDLTQMGLDITDPNDFISLFPLSYYSYNQGSLLSFNGNGLKTVGKNLFNKENVTNGGFFAQDGSINSNPSYSYSDYIPVLPNQKIVISGVTAGGAYTCFYDGNKNLISSSQNQHAFPYTYDAKANYVRVSVRLTELDSCQIELGSTATSYEPYTESTLSLPISTYFPNGMKSAGTVYDELTPSKAITRIGTVDLGTLNYINDDYDVYGRFYTTDLNTLISKSVDGNLNIKCPLFVAVTSLYIIYNNASGMMFLSSQGNLSFTKNGCTTDQEFKNSLQGIYLVYELATPTETSFTTASLVTENAEIPLSNEDGVLIGKCTEQLSENPGFIDAKIKLSDSDGECYSNKLQLHVERSPQ